MPPHQECVLQSGHNSWLITLLRQPGLLHCDFLRPNFVNSLYFDKVIAVCWRSTFFGSQCRNVPESSLGVTFDEECYGHIGCELRWAVGLVYEPFVKVWLTVWILHYMWRCRCDRWRVRRATFTH